MIALILIVFHQTLIVDGQRYTVRLDPAAAQPLQLREHGKTVDHFLKKQWRPWALEIADVDGDGRPDIAVGIVKATHNLRQPHTCLWIMGVRDGHFTRKWLGSTMGRPLLEFCFLYAKPGAKTPLFTLQSTMDGRVALNRYVWHRFGFRVVGSDKTWRSAHGLRQQNGRIVLIADGKERRFLPEEFQ